MENGVHLPHQSRTVEIPLVVTKDALCTQALKDGLVAAFRQAVAPSVVGHRLVHLDLETLCQLFPRLGLEHLVSIGNNLSGASFESIDFTQERIDKVGGCHVLAARDELSSFRESIDHSHDSVRASDRRRQS